MAKHKLLIVEDEPEMRTLLALEFETAGYEVFQAEDGEAALAVAEEARPDIIISDVMMPRMDGNQFMKRLRAAEFGKDIPFIILTARGKMRDYFEAMGACDFIEKPFQTEDLIGKVEAALNKSLLERELGKPGAAKEDKADKADANLEKEEIVIIQEMTKERAVATDAPAEAAKGMPPAPREAPALRERGRKKNILILENDMDAYRELARIFSETGCVLQLASNPHECITEANSRVPDLIILKDIFKVVDATELATNLKTVPRLQKVPIIIYTNIGDKVVGVNPAGTKTTAFVLNSQGKETIRKAVELLAAR